MTSSRFKLKFKVIVSPPILFKYLYDYFTNTLLKQVIHFLIIRKMRFFSVLSLTQYVTASVFQQKQSWLVLKLMIFFQVIQKITENRIHR